MIMSLRTLTTADGTDLRAKSTVRTSLWTMMSFLRHCLRVHAERRHLMSLDDRMLKDIGLSRGEAYREASRSPTDIGLRSRPFEPGIVERCSLRAAAT
jgi:uncharacterized protein YjiS (DUF1127 family)